MMEGTDTDDVPTGSSFEATTTNCEYVMLEIRVGGKGDIVFRCFIASKVHELRVVSADCRH
jgi:hypothetical protein